MKDKIAQAALQVIYQWFREHDGEWPEYVVIERWLNRYPQVDAVQVIQRIPQNLMKPIRCSDGRPEPGAKLVLSLGGVACCLASDADIQNFVHAVKFMAQQDKDYDPPADLPLARVPITARQLADELKLPVVSDEKAIRRLMALLRGEGLVSTDECE